MGIIYGIIYVILVIGSILLFVFFPVILYELTGQNMKISGRKVYFYKDPCFTDTEAARELQRIVLSLDAMGYGPYSYYGMMHIRSHMSKLPQHLQILDYTDNNNIKMMLKWIGIEENEHTRREKLELAKISGVTDIDFSYKETEEGRLLLEIVDNLENENYGPYSNYGLTQITKMMEAKVPANKRIMPYTKENIETMLSAAGIRKNDFTKRDNRTYVSEFDIEL